MRIDRFWVAASLLLFAAVASADEDAGTRNFGGPNAVPNQLESDAFEAIGAWGTERGESWDAWKKKLQEEHGFGIGLDYTGDRKSVV